MPEWKYCAEEVFDIDALHERMRVMPDLGWEFVNGSTATFIDQVVNSNTREVEPRSTTRYTTFWRKSLSQD